MRRCRRLASAPGAARLVFILKPAGKGKKWKVGQGGLAPTGAGRGTRTGRRRHRSWARGSRLRRKLCCSLHSFIIVFVCFPESLALCDVNFSRFRHWSAILGVLWFNIWKQEAFSHSFLFRSKYFFLVHYIVYNVRHRYWVCQTQALAANKALGKSYYDLVFYEKFVHSWGYETTFLVA